MDLSIITVTWNSKEHIAEQMRSVQRGARNITYEQIIVDNNSSDGTVDMVAAVRSADKNVVCIANKENRGFGAANNQGVAIAQGEFFLFLNPDMRLAAGSLDAFIAWMHAHSDVGIAAPKLVRADGTFNWDAAPRRFPRVWEQVVLMLKIPHVFPRVLDGYQMRDADFEIEQDVDSVRGSCMLLRRTLAMTLGWAFDPRYFIWYEDVDICREARRLGYRVVHTPVISCVDHFGQSFKKRETLWKQKQFTRSMLVYFQKWEPWWKWMWIALFRPIGIALTACGRTFPKKHKMADDR